MLSPTRCAKYWCAHQRTSGFSLFCLKLDRCYQEKHRAAHLVLSFGMRLQFEERHVEDYFALIERNKAYLHEWIAVPVYEGPVETLKAYVKQRLLQFVEGSGYHLGIWYRDALVGILDYRLNWRGRNVELGYWLDAAMQGKGIVTAVCRTMVRHAFEEHQVHKVVISCAIDNPRSRAIAERLGFTQEGILRQADRLHDRYVDMVFYGLLKEEWKAEAEQAKADATRKPGDGG